MFHFIIELYIIYIAPSVSSRGLELHVRGHWFYFFDNLVLFELILKFDYLVFPLLLN